MSYVCVDILRKTNMIENITFITSFDNQDEMQIFHKDFTNRSSLSFKEQTALKMLLGNVDVVLVTDRCKTLIEDICFDSNTEIIASKEVSNDTYENISNLDDFYKNLLNEQNQFIKDDITFE